LKQVCILRFRDDTGERLIQMMMGIDQARQDYVVREIDDFVCL
jgi:hypothetical protein